MGAQYRDTWYTLAPPWLRTGNAEKYMYTLQLCTDLLLDKMSQAVKIRMPGQGDASQLPYLSNDRLLVQGPAETNASFVARLQGAFAAWKRAGSRVAVLEQLQAYLQNLQPGVAATLPEMTIVGGCYPNVTTWDTIYQGDPIGAIPAKTTITPANFNWDGTSKPWRAWLILYMSLVATGMSGASAATSTAASGSQLGHNAGGVWVPGGGVTVNSPWLTVTGLTGITVAEVGNWLTLSGSGNAGNNGTFPIVSVSGTSAVIANPNGVTADAGPIAWSVGSYPFIGPGPAWGTPGFVFGEGQLTPPPVPAINTSVGKNVGGAWVPTQDANTFGAKMSWGLTCPPTTIESIRLLLKRWKSAATYYPHIIIAFDGGTGAAGSAYSPNSTPGAGNPDGTFGGHGKLVSGVWVPNRAITSPFDVYCQGTGSWSNCSVENVN
jgi:hypothetical protein